ncbi:hypothetical protein STCU_03127 [Strigomonas culicis]|uniref:Autophagy-related protein n=1 Tax=Strigomonas culicis TaxID=28005 RepID=S9UH89_9TRYP|nr:hypothetical protein STCU_04210 [Strigomonas culicis]EPY31897.1 hypothetical protein STCU_03127 [Strigomonas culicis]|eukprot:EPY30152.1 hypothetical protein STCU_04210 [Strigomonas culicis]
MSYFKGKYTLEERTRKYESARERYPDSILVVCEGNRDPCAAHCHRLRCLPDLTVAALKKELMQRVGLTSEQALYLYVRRYAPANTVELRNLYEKYKDEDGILYFEYAEEDIYGSKNKQINKRTHA